MLVSSLGDDGGALVTQAGNITAGVVTSMPASIASILGVSANVVPLIGTAIAGVALAVGLFLNRNAKYHMQEKATTQIVNQAEVLMKQNLAAWQQSPKTVQAQQQALTNFNTIWNEVVKACSNPQFEDPGKRCVDDRNRGGRWDWFSYYYDPIANDPNVIQPSFAGSISSMIPGLDLSGINPLYVVGGALVLLVASL